MYTNPKNIRTEVKLFFFYVMDAAIFFVTLAVGVALLKQFHVIALLSIVGYFFFGVLGIFLAMRTSRHPIDRNLNMIIHFFRQNRNQYYDFQLDQVRSITEVKELKEEDK